MAATVYIRSSGNFDPIRLAETFRLLGEPNRLSLVCACLEQARSVQDLAAVADISMSLASHHLRLLRSARLLRAERRGKQVFYVAADAQVRRVLLDMTAQDNGA
ncbi:MAG TPA: metalloregulator ArsR/SmtB family transcription factor [Salinisphaeraceae bacterium]|nr:metalloregulator ArsR/SmtB family transcription factor [Salinisphaeraceae bacterium]